MCFKIDCIYSIPVRKSCLVLSVLNAILHGFLLLLWCYMWYRYYIVTGTYQVESNAIDDFLQHGWVVISVTFWLSVVTVSSAITFVFSAVLCCGVYTHRPRLVEVFFLFGVVATILLALVSLVQLAFWIGGAYSGPWGLTGLFASGLYALFLVLVYETYAHLLESEDTTITPCTQMEEVVTMLPTVPKATAPPLYLLKDDPHCMVELYGVD